MTGELSHARVVVGHYAHVRDRLDAAVFTVLAHTSKSLQVLLESAVAPGDISGRKTPPLLTFQVYVFFSPCRYLS
jgi:hypothetical protein